MVLKNSVLTGAVSGGTAPAGTLRVNIEKNGAQGFGPLGPVSLDYFVDEASTTVEGTWNGGRVHLVFAKDSIKGTVASNSFFFSKTERFGPVGHRSLPQPASARAVRRHDRTAPQRRLLRVLPRLRHARRRAERRFDLRGHAPADPPRGPSMARAWMTHAELVTVLVAVLSSPPLVLAEDYGPRFEQPSTGSFPTSPPRGR